MSRPKILIAFYSRNSSTEMLANAVADGAKAEGAEVRLRRAREVVGPDVMRLAPPPNVLAAVRCRVRATALRSRRE